MAIELFYSPYCSACAAVRERAAARGQVQMRDITRHLDAAVRLGIRQPPALVVDGRVIAQGPAALTRLSELCGQDVP